MKSLSYKGKILASTRHSFKSNLFRTFSTTNESTLNIELVRR